MKQADLMFFVPLSDVWPDVDGIFYSIAIPRTRT